MYPIRAKECGVANPMQTYFREINESGLLTALEERELAEAIRRGDDGARGRLIQSNLRLVVKIAREFLHRGMTLEDLIGEGNLGLIRAAEDYDPRFGTRFSTYASYWIKQAIRHALINTTSTIRLPAHLYGLLAKFRRAERALCRERGRMPSFDEVAAHLGLSEVQKGMVDKARRAGQLKLESNLGDDGDSWSPDEAVDTSETPNIDLDRADERAEVLKRMGRLDDRERMVLQLRFGLEGNVPQTLTEIGRRMGVTREWVRKIEVRAVSKLAAAAAAPAGSAPCSSAKASAPRRGPRRIAARRELAVSHSA
ncbi:RNA polymerase sigma factor SigA [Aquisphaera giovannonii]|uniref:RNA polymerase sigma factor SigA n=1 Tax=Aquisphaera giovannonii TaxID=406548 RepID=A0A5B9WDC0_9BACT|nr:RNA polymerase sigma factor RpoD/SigA [Aquisphaera giovannonii]QEH38473.1 RNA polymerase sigma factor SigA [Aquisphaera giovannonii]